MYLQQLDNVFATIEYRPGKQHTNADTLSRIPVHVIHTKVAQQKDELLKPVVDALVNETSLPHNTPPGLRHAQIKGGFYVGNSKNAPPNLFIIS